MTDSTTRENLYVAMTRGREANTAYVALTPVVEEAERRLETITARGVLLGVLQNSGAEASAHQTLKTEQETRGFAGAAHRRVRNHRHRCPTRPLG